MALNSQSLALAGNLSGTPSQDHVTVVKCSPTPVLPSRDVELSESYLNRPFLPPYSLVNASGAGSTDASLPALTFETLSGASNFSNLPPTPSESESGGALPQIFVTSPDAVRAQQVARPLAPPNLDPSKGLQRANIECLPRSAFLPPDNTNPNSHPTKEVQIGPPLSSSASARTSPAILLSHNNVDKLTRQTSVRRDSEPYIARVVASLGKSERRSWLEEDWVDETLLKGWKEVESDEEDEDDAGSLADDTETRWEGSDDGDPHIGPLLGAWVASMGALLSFLRASEAAFTEHDERDPDPSVPICGADELKPSWRRPRPALPEVGSPTYVEDPVEEASAGEFLNAITSTNAVSITINASGSLVASTSNSSIGSRVSVTSESSQPSPSRVRASPEPGPVAVCEACGRPLGDS